MIMATQTEATGNSVSSACNETCQASTRKCQRVGNVYKPSITSQTSNPLLAEYERMEQRRSKPRPSIFRRPTHLHKPARPWDCRFCGLMLGVMHIFFGMFLVVLDLATNYITETIFAVSASICFVITGICSLIATKRLDKGTITILVICSFVSILLALTIIFESVTSINSICHLGTCGSTEATIRACLLLVCLMEAVVCSVSAFVGIRSLMNATSSDLIRLISPVHVFLSGQEAPALSRLMSPDQIEALLLAYR